MTVMQNILPNSDTNTPQPKADNILCCLYISYFTMHLCRWGQREIIYLSLHCHHHNDSSSSSSSYEQARFCAAAFMRQIYIFIHSYIYSFIYLMACVTKDGCKCGKPLLNNVFMTRCLVESSGHPFHASRNCSRASSATHHHHHHHNLTARYS